MSKRTSGAKTLINRGLNRLWGRSIVRTDRLRTLQGRLAEAEKQLAAATAAPQTPAPGKPRPSKKPTDSLPRDYAAETGQIWPMVKSRTMVGHQKLNSFLEATRYITRHDIPGAIVECGVWRGGAMMAVASMLDRLGDHDRDLYLYDTYTGMPEASERDIHLWRRQSADQVIAAKSKSAPIWQPAELDDVQAGFEPLAYPRDRLHFVAGKVENTIPDQAPDQIAILRLDTDWYESTKHSLEQLYPRVAPGGVLILDDYGSWQGARDATDEFLHATGEPLLLARVSRGRIAVKPGLRSRL